MNKYCDWCGDPATCEVRVGNIKKRVCEDCAAYDENKVESYLDTDGIMK